MHKTVWPASAIHPALSRPSSANQGERGKAFKSQVRGNVVCIGQARQFFCAFLCWTFPHSSSPTGDVHESIQIGNTCARNPPPTLTYPFPPPPHHMALLLTSACLWKCKTAVLPGTNLGTEENEFLN